MIFNLHSTDPDNYGTIRFNSQLPLSAENIKFRITGFNTIATFMITTKDDYIKFELDGEILEFYFEDRAEYDRFTFENQIESFLPSEMDVTFNITGTLTLSYPRPFKIVDASHRVRLLLGFYEDIEFPILSGENDAITFKSAPYFTFGNNYYLTSSLSNVCAFNDSKNKQVNKSICYSIQEFVVSGLPMMSKIPGPLVSIRPLELSNLEFTLVDFQHEPIICKAPIHIVLEVLF